MSTASYRNFSGTGAETYQRYFVLAIATPVSAELLRTARLRAGERVLDVACGTGLIARAAAEQVGRTGTVTGIDVAPDMIDVARRVPSPDGAAIDWRVAEASALPFRNDSYDAVLCQMGLMFMEDRPAALAEMRRVLTPGGRIVVNTPGKMQPVFQVLEQALVDHIDPELGGFVRAVFSMHDPEALATLLREARLHDVQAWVSSATLRLPAPVELLWQYISVTPMAPLVAQAPEDAKAAMERQVVDRCQPFVLDGETRVEQPMLIASGRK